MSIVELVALFLILIVAIVCQAMKDEVNPIVWLVGGIVGFAVKFVDAGMCSWKEGLITLAIMVVVMIVAGIINVIGGGTLKGIWMTSIYLGRYSVVMIVVFFILCAIVGLVKKSSAKNEDSIRMVNGILILTIATAIAVAVYYLRVKY